MRRAVYILENIGKEMLEYRTDRGMTCEDLGVLLGVTKQSVNSYENKVTKPAIPIAVAFLKMIIDEG